MTPFDGWTIAHLLTGTFLALVETSRKSAYTIIIGTEIAELIARRSGVRFFGETKANVTIDLITSAGSFEITKAVLSGRRT